MEVSENQAEPRRRFFPSRLLHLLWTVPLAGAASFLPFVSGAINICGISGCTGGGFGVHYGAESSNWISALLIAGFFTIAVGAIPWIRPHRIHIVIGIAVGVAIGAWLITGWLGAKYEYYPAGGSCYPTVTADPDDCP
jgi:hypothetical protein